jgi:hydrogenase expression/formation protein HypD
VCVTPLEMIDRAHAIALRSEVIFCSFGDMLRVPGTHGDLLACKAQGADVRVVYSPLDALELAARNPDRQVVFFAIGFETTAPANAMAVTLARKNRLRNFSMLVSHVLVPPAMSAILSAPDNRVQGFLGPGHVCAVMGLSEYRPLAERHRVPVVITGFEPLDLLAGVLQLVQRLERGEHAVDNAYGRSVPERGNPGAQRAIEQVFQVCDRTWRGVGVIPRSGYCLRDEYCEYDAERRFAISGITAREPPECISGAILRGVKKPHQCSEFGTRCTPDMPLGATMVSSEGACAAYHAYRHGQQLTRLRLAVS